LASLVSGINSIFAASLPTSIAGDCLTLLGEIAAVGGALAMVGRARHEHLTAGDESAAQAGARSRLPWILAALAAWLALAAALMALLTGFLALSSFLMRETIWIGAVLALIFLLLRLADDLFPALLSPNGPVGRAVMTAIGLSESALEQIGVLLSGVVRLGLLLFGWVTILAPFGASADDVIGRVTTTSWTLHVGQVAVSPGAILGGIALFAVGLLATRGVRGWLESRYLPKTGMDVGVRTSLAAAVSYAGVIVAILLTFAYLGLSFSQIALFASALSVGIGFGLQAIINNFVSGLILLVERPIKVGDWIAIGDLEGDVKAINIRATEIEMLDRSKLIVPNSDLISKTVRNVTHGASAARLRITLRTDTNVDPAAMRDLMLGRIKAHPEILAQPAPGVFLSDVRDGALEFTAFAYVASARVAYRVKSDLLFQIVPDMKTKGIALASSTPVVNIGLPDRLIEPETGQPG
jgi:small-conductance mechanosensitive channel